MKNFADKILTAWNDFFFKPTSSASLGLFRICFGLVVFVSTLGRFPGRNIFYGADAIVSLDTVHHYFSNDLFYFLWVPGQDPWLAIYFVAILLFTFCLIIGWQTRVASVLVFLGIISLSNRNLFIDNAGDDLVRINLFFLMFAPSGKAYSVDRWLRVHRGLEPASEFPPIFPWAQRLLQIQLMYLYLNTFYYKLPGPLWREGVALYYSMGYLELRRFDFKYMFYTLWQIKLATWSVMAAEISMPLLVWFRRTRYWVLAAGAALHFGINLTMQFPVFQYVMLVSLLNFIDPEDVERVVSWISLKCSRKG